jgi:hypothetical protein
MALNSIRCECCVIGDCVKLLAAERVPDECACHCAERRGSVLIAQHPVELSA